MGLVVDVFNTRRGWIAIAGSPNGICISTLPADSKSSAMEALFSNARCRRCEHIKMDQDSPALRTAKEALISYFQGERVEFSFPIDLDGYTRFQRDVWEVTRLIPYGELRSYGWVSAQIGRPRSARAVGQALKNNPLPIIIPCHRVVASDGSLCGFTGGLPWKEELIRLEKAQ